MKAIAAILLSVFLSACAMQPLSPEEAGAAGARPTIAQAQNAAERYVNNRGLYDPGSAQIRNLQVGEPVAYNTSSVLQRKNIVYGYKITFDLNAKNRFGAYTGFKPQTIVREPGGRIYWRIGQ